MKPVKVFMLIEIFSIYVATFNVNPENWMLQGSFVDATTLYH